MTRPKLVQRAAHIPLSYVVDTNGFDLIPNRCQAIFANERYPIEDYVQKFIIRPVQLSEQYSAPTLAFNVYSEMELWWFLCIYNGIYFPTQQLHSGLMVKIPDKNQVLNYLTLTEKILFPQSNNGLIEI